MSCGRIALDRAGIKVNNYYASELDKYAITVTQANWPETVQLGDVTKWREWSIDWASIDLLIGGSPCQGFSFAGKQLAFDDPRSALFFEYLNILNHIKTVNPNVKFLLENVKMKKEYLEVISSMLKVEPVFINSALVSAQNRQRYYWANWDFAQPEDKGVVMADIIESPPTSVTIMSDKFTKRQEGRKCLVSKPKAKAVSFSAMEYVKNGRQGDYIKCTDTGDQLVFSHPASIVGRRINEKGVRDDYNKDVPITQCLQVKHNPEKTGCITTVQKDNVIASVTPGRYVDVYGAMTEGLQYRKLTPVEVERLQTVPDNYTNHVSNTQRYKMLGNGWTVEVIAHIFKGIA